MLRDLHSSERERVARILGWEGRPGASARGCYADLTQPISF